MILPSPFQLRVFPDSMIDFFIFSSLKGEEISTKTQFIYLFPVGGEKKIWRTGRSLDEKERNKICG